MMEITGANCYVAEAGQSMKGIGNGESLSAIALLVDHGGCSVSLSRKQDSRAPLRLGRAGAVTSLNSFAKRVQQLIEACRIVPERRVPRVH
jgi:hypothetical protein